jgi:DNA mismatch repair protein MutS
MANSKASTETPLMQQHNAIKAKYPDAILLFRVGDFYETFGTDAIKTAKILGITLTRRNNGAAGQLELAGFPHHALDTYLHKLVKAGLRVAVCDQLEDPKQAKGIVKRGVTDMVTPGTALDDKLLDRDKNNYLAALHYSADAIGICLTDISTGECMVAEGDVEWIDKLLQSYKPAELLYSKANQKWFKENFGNSYYTYLLDDWIYSQQYTQELLIKQFETTGLKGFGIEHLHYAQIAAGAVLHYLKETEHPHLSHIAAIKRIDREEHLWMDKFTIRNLELIRPAAEGGKCLLQVIDQTASPMGARMLRQWLLFPLNNKAQIEERLQAVQTGIEQQEQLNQINQWLKRCGDIERVCSKIANRKVGPREALQIAKTLEYTAEIKKLVSELPAELFIKLAENLQPANYLLTKIKNTLLPEPATLASKGGIINVGVHTELDELRQLSKSGKDYLLQLQQKETEATGISSLKIGFNNVFGYYLEVTNTHKNKVPAEWIRKQTMTNAERYITPELKEYEEKILGAEDKILQLEQELYATLVEEMQAYIPTLQVNARLLAQIDIITCFAQLATQNNYSKPSLLTTGDINITEGRHPVIEKTLPLGEPYITNNVLLNAEQQIIVLTGPNMSGKSALLRQTALIVLMAHMGCYVPAEQATIPITQKIFTRVGASDNLSEGESTFMVEMNETASIMNNLGGENLILLDEIGRGTSTYDGISIAWSLVEYLAKHPSKPKTLFATHYHELNDLEEQQPNVKNYHVSNKEVGNKIIFLRKMVPGGSTHSFGIHVARMAGMPASIVARANEVLAMLEEQHKNNPQAAKQVQPSPRNVQLNIFDAHTQVFEELRQVLSNLDINRLTPVEALLKLQEIKNKLG